MSAITSVALTSGHIGRPTLITDELVDKILANLATGNYVKPSVEATGIDYTTFRAWIAKGEADKGAGRETPFSKLIDRLAHAQAAAEANIVGELRKAEDWRAQAFILERRHRERWGKDEQQTKVAVQVQIPESLAQHVLEAMRVAATAIEIPASPIPASMEYAPTTEAEFEQVPASDIQQTEPPDLAIPSNVEHIVETRRR